MRQLLSPATLQSILELLDPDRRQEIEERAAQLLGEERARQGDQEMGPGPETPDKSPAKSR